MKKVRVLRSQQSGDHTPISDPNKGAGVANGEDVKVEQELLRQGAVKITIDIYAQARMSTKRRTKRKVVEMVSPQGTLETMKVGA